MNMYALMHQNVSAIGHVYGDQGLVSNIELFEINVLQNLELVSWPTRYALLILLSEPNLSIPARTKVTGAYRHAQILDGCWQSVLKDSQFCGDHFTERAVSSTQLDRFNPEI